MAGMGVRRSADRYRTRTPGIETWHSFSFGPHYDPANTSYGVLLLHDEHRLAPGAGFGPHLHRELDIVTWVVEGELVHEDERGTATVPAGHYQRLVAGAGSVHAERAGGHGARFVQLWLAPAGEPASYEHGVLPPGGLTRQDGTRICVANVHTGAELVLPQAPLLHLFVGSGSVVLGDGTALEQGDAARLPGGPRAVVRARTAAQVLLVAMHSLKPPE